MEQFSNNRDSYWNQIKKELQDSNKTENFTFQYLEMGSLYSHGFSTVYSEKQPLHLHLKVWNAEFDNKRYNKGIFNLDRLAITENRIELSLQESRTIISLLNQKLSLTNWEGIVIDGLFCQFQMGDQKLEWNTHQEMNQNLTELVELLRSKVI